MRSNCRRHVAVSSVAVALWAVVLWLGFVVQPGLSSFMRLPFFVLMGAAMNATVLAGMPWMLRGFVRDQTLAYVAGYLHRESDEPVEESRRLRAVR